MRVLVPLLSKQENSPEFIDKITTRVKEIILLVVVDTNAMVGRFGFAANEIREGNALMEEIKELTVEDLKDGYTPGVDMGHLYNRLYEMIAEGYGDIAVDKYGAWGYVDECGFEYWGDAAGFFEWIMDEETLRKTLDDRMYDCGAEKEADFEAEMERGIVRAERTHPVTGEEL